MKTSRKLLLAGLLCGSSIQAFAGAAAIANVSDCWIRALPGDLPSGGYFKASNTGDQPVNVVGVGSEAGIPVVESDPASDESRAFLAVAERIHTRLN